MKAFKRAEGLSRPSLTELFNDVYAGQEPWTIVSVRMSLVTFTFAVKFVAHDTHRKNNGASSPVYSRNTARHGTPGRRSWESSRTAGRT